LRASIRDSTQPDHGSVSETAESSIDEYFTDSFTKLDRSEVRTIRLPKSLEAELIQEASSKGMSVSALIYSILDRHVHWESVAQKFGFLTLPKETLSIGISHLEPKTVAEIARLAGKTVPRQFILFLFNEVTPSTFLRWVDFVSRYERTADWKVERTGDRVVMTGHHQMDSNWSAWIASYMGEAVRSTLNIEPEVALDERTIKIIFGVPRSKPTEKEESR